MSNQIKISRYPGTRPFELAERGLFYGREREINDLTRMTILERLVVLFGKSGYGKSSLLQAGVLPKLGLQEEIWTPISIRLGVYNGQVSPNQIVVEHLKKGENGENTEGSFLDDSTLWKAFKKRQSPEKARILLIFDQFEEFFTYPLAQQKAFKTALAELIYSSMPQAIVEEFKAAPIEQQRFLARAMNIHVLVSIRSDKLSFLHSLKDALPAILHSRFELQGLNIAQARQAIEAPATAEKSTINFTAPPYTFEKEALDFMVNKLSERSSEVLIEPQIEAFQLQIVCQEIEDKVINSGKIIITKADLPSFEAVYEDYYQTQIDKISDPVIKKVARIILEEKLISGNLDNNSARREPMSGSKLMEEAAATQDLLDNLVNFRLLRREPNSLGGDSYEISHDTLISPVLKSKNIRKTAEKEAENHAKFLLDKQETAAKAKLEARQTLKKLALMVGGLLLLLVGISFYFSIEKDRNTNARIARITNSLIHDKPFDALQIAYAIYGEEKIPLSSVTLSNTFYKFLKLHDGYVYQEITMPELVQSAAFTDAFGEIQVVLFDPYKNKTDTIFYDLKNHKTVPFTHQKALQTAARGDSLTLLDGRLKAEILTDSLIEIIDNREKYTQKYRFKTEFTTNISFSANGDKILTSHFYERKIRIWHFAAKNMFVLRGPNFRLESAVFSPDSLPFLLTIGSDSSVVVWTNQRQKMTKIKGFKNEINSAIFSKNGAFIVTASKDKLIKIIKNDGLYSVYDSLKLAEKPTEIVEGNNVLLINLFQEDSELYSFIDGKINKIKALKGVRNAGFMANNTAVIGINKDSLVAIYDLKTDKMDTLPINIGRLFKAVYSVDNKQLLITTYKGEAFVFENNKLAFKLKAVDVNHAIFSKNGEFMATASSSDVLIWNKKGEQIAEWQHKSGFNSVHFSADNQYVAGTGIDGRVFVLPLPETIYKWLKINDFSMDFD